MVFLWEGGGLIYLFESGLDMFDSETLFLFEVFSLYFQTNLCKQ